MARTIQPKTSIHIGIGCPSGSTDGWSNGSITIQVSEGFEDQFVEAILEHARYFAEQYTLTQDEYDWHQAHGLEACNLR